MNPVLPHGRVTGHYGVALPAIGGAPQEGPTLPASGIIIFRPEVERLLISQGEEEPETLIPAPVTCILDKAGDLINPDEPTVKGVSLLANQGIADMNPGSWLWRAHVILTHAGHTIWQTSFPVPVHAGITSDLADLAPVSTTAGDIVRGAKGETGERGADGYQGVDGAPGPAPQITIGSVAKGRDAAVTVTGTSPDLRLDFIVPEGGGSFATIPEQFERFGKIRVQFDGKAPTLDGYRCLNGYQPAVGDRVAMVTVDSELIIAGRVGGIVQTPPPFINVPVDPVDPWKNADPYRYGDIRACKTSQDWVVVTGVVIVPSGARAGDTILQLPGTHRPIVREGFSLTFVNQSSGRPSAVIGVFVEEDGRVTLATQPAAGAWLSLSGITFNTNTGNRVAYAGEFSIGMDIYGLVNLSGFSEISSILIPAEYRPVVPTTVEKVNVAGSPSTASIPAGSNAVASASNASWSAARFYSGSADTLIWNTLPLQNGYRHNTTADGPLQYAIRPDGLVAVRGQVTGGLSNSTVAVLPEGVRPPYEIHGGLGAFSSAGSNKYTITPGGSIMGPTTSSTTATVYFPSILYFPSH